MRSPSTHIMVLTCLGNSIYCVTKKRKRGDTSGARAKSRTTKRVRLLEQRIKMDSGVNDQVPDDVKQVFPTKNPANVTREHTDAELVEFDQMVSST